jgi:DNA-directed RNA polymerase specialized sigma24 family protein
VLAQRAVDLARAQRRTQPLDADGMASRAGADAGPADPRRPGYAALLSAALFAVLATLASRDRLRLALYHGQGLTLAEAGRVLGESEATVSRKLERARRVLRDGTARRLREVDRLGEAEVDACFEHAVEDWQGDLIGVLQEPLSPTFSRQEDTG